MNDSMWFIRDVFLIQTIFVRPKMIHQRLWERPACCVILFSFIFPIRIQLFPLFTRIPYHFQPTFAVYEVLIFKRGKWEIQKGNTRGDGRSTSTGNRKVQAVQPTVIVERRTTDNSALNKLQHRLNDLQRQNRDLISAEQVRNVINWGCINL